ncbi:MAG TPA: transglutaminase family protein, partial [Vineibacter sp.]|nr:transglutaminase family protein [Vineibacter sp.]
MSIQVALHHRTTYVYDRPVVLGPQIVRLRPAPHCRTPILSYALDIEPGGHFINWQQDPQGNYVARLVFPEAARRFEVKVDLIADMAVINPFDFFLDPEAETFPFQYDPALSEDLAPFRKTVAPGPLLRQWLVGIDRTSRRSIDFLVELNRRLQHDIGYVIRMEPGIQTFEETLALAKGSCRDTGWLLVNILRHLGFAARFVSGYLIQLRLDEKPLEGPEGPAQDFTDLHAWCEVYLPGAGWIGLDPTSGLLAGEGHIPLAATAEPQSAAPVEGQVGKAEVAFSFDMAVTRVRETPRTTKPYTEEAWRCIVDLGDAIDRDLNGDGMNLTMGGEPTFVSVDDMDGAEWNTEALGANKRRIAGHLFRALARRFGKGPLLHYGQGKWYPGEQLPRWALTSYWRRDGEPVWRDPRLFAHEEKPSGATPELAGRFAQVLAERLQVDPGFAVPAFEDTWYYLWRERRLPVNVDPAHSNLKDPLERSRLARVFEQELESVAGHLLPLQRAPGRGRRWRSGPWFVRSQRLYLIPGDSPIGYRLPLDSLPWTTAEDQVYFFDADPLMARAPLPSSDTLRLGAVTRLQARQVESNGRSGPPSAGRDDGANGSPPTRGQSAARIVRTAMAFEPRNGHMHVFMPPTEDAEDYLHLVAAVEATAEELGCPVF